MLVGLLHIATIHTPEKVEHQIFPPPSQLLVLSVQRIQFCDFLFVLFVSRQELHPQHCQDQNDYGQDTKYRPLTRVADRHGIAKYK